MSPWMWEPLPGRVARCRGAPVGEPLPGGRYQLGRLSARSEVSGTTGDLPKRDQPPNRAPGPAVATHEDPDFFRIFTAVFRTKG